MKDISIFVSSTFVDMQSERDLLRERILPELEEHVKKYGVNINFIDLRWGIDTSDVSEEASTNKIVKTCVDEIIGSKPYFISLIGERYGWIPEQKYIENALYSLGLNDARGFEDISITEFEIRVAEYLGKADIRSLYFLREPIDYGADEASRKNSCRRTRTTARVSTRLKSISATRSPSAPSITPPNGRQRIGASSGWTRSALPPSIE